jgi:hypothetical protein
MKIFSDVKWYVRLIVSGSISLVLLAIYIGFNPSDSFLYGGLIGTWGWSILDHIVCYFKYHRKNRKL